MRVSEFRWLKPVSSQRAAACLRDAPVPQEKSAPLRHQARDGGPSFGGACPTAFPLISSTFRLRRSFILAQHIQPIGNSHTLTISKMSGYQLLDRTLTLVAGLTAIYAGSHHGLNVSADCSPQINNAVSNPLISSLCLSLHSASSPPKPLRNHSSSPNLPLPSRRNRSSELFSRCFFLSGLN